jgi:nicotinamide-nucleotide amidase
LNVSKVLLAHCGAVSPEVAQALAVQTLVHSRAKAAFSITGFAGPASENDNHPVGTVYIGYASEKRPQGVVKHFLLPGERYEVRQAAMLESLCYLHQNVEQDFP